MIKANNIGGMLLAGGAGSRMGGVDKGLIEWHGQPLYRWTLARFAPQVETLLISANRNLESYGQAGYRLLRDDESDFQGPLAGILTGLRHTATPWLAVAPCDTPLLPCDLVQRLASSIGSEPAAVAVAGGRLQPVCCLLHTDLAERLERDLAAGQRRAGEWLRQLPAATANWPEIAPFLNLNHPHELASTPPPAGENSR
jgi:molybdopterin-guanine dinucleotide biosynthesis protein A